MTNKIEPSTTSNIITEINHQNKPTRAEHKTNTAAQNIFSGYWKGLSHDLHLKQGEPSTPLARETVPPPKYVAVISAVGSVFRVISLFTGVIPLVMLVGYFATKAPKESPKQPTLDMEPISDASEPLLKGRPHSAFSDSPPRSGASSPVSTASRASESVASQESFRIPVELMKPKDVVAMRPNALKGYSNSMLRVLSALEKGQVVSKSDLINYMRGLNALVNRMGTALDTEAPHIAALVLPLMNNEEAVKYLAFSKRTEAGKDNFIPESAREIGTKEGWKEVRDYLKTTSLSPQEMAAITQYVSLITT